MNLCPPGGIFSGLQEATLVADSWRNPKKFGDGSRLLQRRPTQTLLADSCRTASDAGGGQPVYLPPGLQPQQPLAIG
jgi:hypothetical protein